MKRALNDQERLRLDQRVAEVEKRTGVQIVRLNFFDLHNDDSYNMKYVTKVFK